MKTPEPSSPNSTPKTSGQTPEMHENLLDRLNRRRQRLWRRTKRTVRVLVAIPLVLALVLYLGTRTPVVRWVVASRVESLLGAEFDASRAVIELDGRLALKDPVFRVKGVPGEAGRLLSAESAYIELDWSGAFGGRVTPLAVRLDKPVLVLSQSKGDGSVNIASVMSAGGGASGTIPPEITLSDGILRFAEHDAGGNVTVLKDIRASGSLLPIRAGSPVFTVAMTESVREGPDVGPRRVMVLDGQVDLSKGDSQIRLRNIALSDWPAESVPTAYRDVWARLGVKGDITRVDMSATRAGGVSVEMSVSDVSMSALVPAGNATPGGPPPADLGMRGVSGTIRIAPSGVRAELQGRIDGQQGLSRVRLNTQGLEVTSPMTCEIRGTRIKVTKDPAFLSYVPRTVRQYFEYFSGPTADVDVVATISRASPVNGQPAPIGVSGTLNFRNGAAAFHRFPYPFTDMSGVVRFDESRLIIDQIRGRGPTGAAMSAQGVIGPLTDDAKVDVTINVQRVPIDEHLLKAMPKDRREAAETIFDRAEYDRLLTSNLIREPNKPGIDGTRTAPPCPFAGDGDVVVHVTRELGPESIWTTNVDCRFRELGVVAKPFPLPIIGRDVRLRITDTDASIENGEFVGPRGGLAIVNARVIFFENGERVVKPTLTLKGSGLQIDELLFQALERIDDKRETKGSGLAGAALQRVALAGTIDCLADVRALPPKPDAPPGSAPEIDYDFRVDLDGLRALPRLKDRDAALGVSEFQGIVQLTPTRVRMDNVQARLARTTGFVGPEAPSDVTGPVLPAGSADAGYVNLSLDAAIGKSPEAGALGATVRVDGLQLSDRIEDIVQIASPEAAEWIQSQRSQRDPQGSIDIVVRAGRTHADSSAPPELAVSLARAHDVEFNSLGGRIGIDVAEGSMLLQVPPAGPATFRATGVRSQLEFNGQAAGSANIDGLITIDQAKGRIVAPTTATAALSSWRFESPIVLPALGAFGGERARQRLEEFSPVGIFDADVKASAEGDAAELAVSGSIRPYTLSIERAGQRIAFDRVLGGVTFSSTPGVGLSGCVDQVVGSTDHWTARVDGSFSAAPSVSSDPRAPGGDDSDVRVDLALDVDATQTDDALLALIPHSAREAIQKLEVTLSGPVALKAGRLTGSLDNPAIPLSFAGVVSFASAKLDAGVNVDRMAGELDIRVATPGAGLPDDVRLQLRSPRLSVLGVSLESLDLLASSTARPGEIFIERFTAESHDGRVFGSALLQPAGDSGRKTYRVDAVASGVAFAPLLQELSAVGAAEPLVGPMPDESRDPDVSRGRLDASLTLSGVTGDQRSRVGRGAIRVSHGDVLRLPIIFPLMQLSNLVLPSEETLRALEAEYHITGTRAYFPRVVASGKTIAMHGSGTLDLPALDIDFRFNSRNNNPIPILSNIWEALRDEIVTTTLTGTLSDPKIGSQSLTGIRALFAGSRGPGEDPLTTDQLLSAQMAEIGRLNHAGQSVPTIPPTAASAGAPSSSDDR